MSNLNSNPIQSQDSNTEILKKNYFNPEVLVSTSWVSENLTNPKIKIVESNEDQLLYKSAHIPGAFEIDWIRDLNQPVVRDYLEQESFQKLLSKIGITQDTTVVLYGDKNNWWATYTFWVFKLYQHKDVKIMDGGRLKWELEKRPLSKEVPSTNPSIYRAPKRDDKKERIFRDQVLEHVNESGKLIDVRSPEEFSGERLHMEGYPNEGALRGGHIKGAVNIPWSMAINKDDGTFKDKSQLLEIYNKDSLLDSKGKIVAYCRIGERSSHTWFVLKYLLGYENVTNYDGSWTEWGNLVGVPIEKSL